MEKLKGITITTNDGENHYSLEQMHDVMSSLVDESITKLLNDDMETWSEEEMIVYMVTGYVIMDLIPDDIRSDILEMIPR